MPRSASALGVASEAALGWREGAGGDRPAPRKTCWNPCLALTASDSVTLVTRGRSWHSLHWSSLCSGLRAGAGGLAGARGAALTASEGSTTSAWPCLCLSISSRSLLLNLNPESESKGSSWRAGGNLAGYSSPESHRPANQCLLG